MPRGVASIDPQDFPCLLPAVPPSVRLVGLAALTPPRRRALPHRRISAPPAASPCPSGALTILPGLLPFLPSRSHFPASLAAAPTPPASLFRRCEPHHHRRRRRLHRLRHHPTARSSVTWSFDRGRCLELESRRVRRIRRTFADPGLDPPATLRMEIKAEPRNEGEEYAPTATCGLLPGRRSR